MYNLNESLTEFTSKCKHLSSEPADHTVCKSCAIAWAKRLADEEAMHATWKSMDDLTLTGLEVLRQVIDKEIRDRNQEKYNCD